MCGIAGLIDIYGRPETQLKDIVASMLHRLRHRGPDGRDVQAMPGAALGHARLSIIDLAGGRQPIANEDRSIWIVCNGEIYNYRELRQSLIARGHRFRTQSDSEVILHLYEDEGKNFLKQLRGMFAFAIYDLQNRRLFSARDHLGQKPFYYSETEGGLAYASEIKGLWPSRAASPAVDSRALLQYFSLRIIAPPNSMFEGVRKLPPAHCLTFDADQGLRVAHYWKVGYEPKWPQRETALIDALEERLIEAVKLHLVADVEVGAFLSGGLDSTMIAAIAAKHCGAKGMPTFTFGLPLGQYDESPAAREVAQMYGTEHHEDIVTLSLLRYLPELVACLDEPSDPLSVCSYMTSQVASKRVKVCLGGDGGDEFFGGYDRYYGHLYAGWYAHLPEAIRRGLIGPLLGMIPDGKWYKSVGHQLKWLHHGSFMQGGERHASNLGYFYMNGAIRDDLLGPAMTDIGDSFDPYSAIVDAYNNAEAEHPIDRMLSADSQIRLPDHSVMIVDRTSMAHGLEVRAPFLDHEIVEFCARLPTNLKVKFRSLRYIQKELAKPYLPPSVLHRKKQGFSSPLP